MVAAAGTGATIVRTCLHSESRRFLPALFSALGRELKSPENRGCPVISSAPLRVRVWSAIVQNRDDVAIPERAAMRTDPVLSVAA